MGWSVEGVGEECDKKREWELRLVFLSKKNYNNKRSKTIGKSKIQLTHQ